MSGVNSPTRSYTQDGRYHYTGQRSDLRTAAANIDIAYPNQGLDDIHEQSSTDTENGMVPVDTEL
jgi:hypothetical protein